jgi:hypothetical protein
MPAGFDSLFQSLPDLSVVVLNASQTGCHALVMSKVSRLATSLELVLFQDLLQLVVMKMALPGDMSNAYEQLEETRAMNMQPRGKSTSTESAHTSLWVAVVKPVVQALQLKVS